MRSPPLILWLVLLANAASGDLTFNDEDDLDVTPFSRQKHELRCLAVSKEGGVCVEHSSCNMTDDFKTLIAEEKAEIKAISFQQCPKRTDICCPEWMMTHSQKLRFGSRLRHCPKSMANRNLTRRSAERNLGCGYSSPIVNSSNMSTDQSLLQSGEFPWMVAVLRILERDHTLGHIYDYRGGGCIIHPKVVLTSAGIVQRINIEQLRVRSGERNTLREENLYPCEDHEVQKLVQHENFDQKSPVNDIALLFLAEPFKIEGNPHVGMACLGHEQLPPGTMCIATGWVRMNQKKVELRLVSRTECLKSLKSFISSIELAPTLICARQSERRETCSGDRGAPLVCRIGEVKENRYAQYGGVRLNLGCSSVGLPGVHTDVIEFRDWISERLRDEHLDPSSFEYQ